ncbi:MAG: CE1 family esterase [Planctomycetota bacterium]|jgi:polyhydroxybutyrate depolymerase
MRKMIVMAGAVAALMLICAAACAKKKKDDNLAVFYPPDFGGQVTPGNHSGAITYGGLTRTFKYHVPASWTYGNEQALVFALHGGGGTSEKMISVTLGGFDVLSEADGFIVVYPDAYENHWNDGRGLERYASMLYNVDDVGFILSLIEYFENGANIDRARVYSTGISNGSFMSHRLAMEASGSFAAIAPVVGQMTENLSVLTPAAPVPACIFVGLDDPLIPAAGGEITILGATGYGIVVSATATVNFWVTHNGCETTPTATLLPDIDPNDGTTVRKYVYANTGSGAEVVYYEIEHGGHTWPNGDAYLGEWLVGKVCRDIDGNTVIWNFFKTHSR